MQSNYAGLSKRIVQWREKKGLSQRELGDILGVTGSCISQWETGSRKDVQGNDMPPEQVEALSREMGVQPAWLMFGVGPMDITPEEERFVIQARKLDPKVRAAFDAFLAVYDVPPPPPPKWLRYERNLYLRRLVDEAGRILDKIGRDDPAGSVLQACVDGLAPLIGPGKSARGAREKQPSSTSSARETSAESQPAAQDHRSQNP